MSTSLRCAHDPARRVEQLVPARGRGQHHRADGMCAGVAAGDEIGVDEATVSHRRQFGSCRRRPATSATAILVAMPAALRHFAVNASDPDAAQRFYAATFGWSFAPWGPPGFFRIDSGPEPVQGALQQRRELLPDAPMRGFECTFGVDDVHETARAAVAAGGRVLMEPTTIAGVGNLVWLADPDGNAVGAMQYDSEPG